MSMVLPAPWSAVTCHRFPAWLTCQPGRAAPSGARALSVIAALLRPGKQRDKSRCEEAATGRSAPNSALRIPHSAFHR